jgi:mono/diheme cytochrome c family protein
VWKPEYIDVALFRLFAASSAVILVVGASAGDAQTAVRSEHKAVQFDTGVSPVFKSNCTSCHGGSVKLKNLNLTTEQAALQGSESGAVIVPGKPDESLLYQKVRSGSMPAGKPHLSEAELNILKS